MVTGLVREIPKGEYLSYIFSYSLIGMTLRKNNAICSIESESLNPFFISYSCLRSVTMETTTRMLLPQ